ncbi:hypothetical protein [Saccharolobus islandicus]|uniref:Uncharacterized protein n=1 Tax=Saccharolobus islandicus (strain M.16.4 / Kamchatka \|nr:hypothetical protein [Sulfolobus islandicus]ACR41370.1 hypothetical protein M164_0752 [Sulfolobus islandicus M.16.4]
MSETQTVTNNCFNFNNINICTNATGVIFRYNNNEIHADLDELKVTRSLRAILEDLGFSREEAGKLVLSLQNTKEFSELINKINSPNIISFCLDMSKYDICTKELVNDPKDGIIKLVKYSLVTDEQTKQVTRAFNNFVPYAECYIDHIAKVKLIGLNESNIYKVIFVKKDGNIINVIGDNDIIERSLKECGAKRDHSSDIIKMLIENAKIEEQLYYSSGPWVVNNKVVFAKTSGYITQWKEDVKFSILENYDAKDVKRGIELIEKLINNYGNPAKAIAIISYGVIAWAKHWFVDKAQYFPNLIIYGKENLGKTLLLDLLKVMYNAPDDLTPLREYQLRRVSTLTTIPAILTEGNPFVEAMKKDEKLLQALTLISTSNIFTRAGSYEYGGLYLPIRAFLIPTNEPVDDIVPYVKDKIIIIRFMPNEGFKDNPSVITPKRMTEDDKKAVRAVMAEVFKEFERRILDIEKAVKSLSREKLYEYYIELGYDILHTISSRFLITLPKPYIQTYNADNKDVEEIIREAFYMFIEKEKNERTKQVDADDPPIIDPENPQETLDKCHFFISTKYNTVVFNSAFLRRFGEHLVKEYGMQRYGNDRLAEILNVRRTRITRYGQTLNNVYEIEYNKSKEEYCKSLDGKDIDEKEKEYCAQYGFYDSESHIFKVYK